ncbi:RNase P protein subunit [Tieghemostelium lacteum]|uniref:RNase P protein subunit n=1 Tax=Tieghemostelium lacteum TaxID=361077 RepID=A0A151Z5R1_TIELA|nr:RNase P protein subunit [Tieghemostelium lacteum]|eukprot:KYQ89291.1 RNase P protein subunit [Tieghemostelium lacteum]
MNVDEPKTNTPTITSTGPEKPPNKPTAKQSKKNEPKSSKKEKTAGISDSNKTLNYLYQASNLLTTQGNLVLARHYNKSSKQIALKTVQRLNKSIKRTTCKRCCAVLIPGITSTNRISDNRESHLVTTCKHCKKVKRFPIKSDKNIQ